MAQENLESYLTGISHSVGREMAGYSHTLPCCLSKLRSSLEAGKKQHRIWLQYAYVRWRRSFTPPLVLLLSPYGDSVLMTTNFRMQTNN